MATTSTTGLMSWEEFEQLPENDEGCHREILEGELQLLPPVKLRHSRVAKRAFRALSQLEEKGLGEALFEAGFKLSTSPASWIQPDASFVRADRVSTADEDGYYSGAPNLAVEVVSPSETAAQLRRKIDLLLACGSEAVWVAYQKTRTVVVHIPGGTSYSRGVGDTLSAPFLLAGWEFPVAKLFED
jgi:Uma2 family endonuclease